MGSYYLPHSRPRFASVERLTPLDNRRMVLGYIAILILILILAPMPHSLWDVANDVSPYL